MMSSLKMLLFLLLGHFILLSLLANVADAAGGVFKMPVRKHNKVFVDHNGNKNHHHQAGSSLLLLTNSSTITIENATSINGGGTVERQPVWRSGHFYTTNITIGTPAQEFKVLLDTGSSEFWLSRKNCCTVNSEKKRFDPKASSSYVNASYEFDTSYGGGKMAIGYWAHDTMTIDPIDCGNGNALLVIANASFGLVTAMDSMVDNAPFDGIVGLGYNEEFEHGFVAPLQQAVEQGLLDKKMFTVYLPPPLTNASSAAADDSANGKDDDDEEGYFTWGGLDTQNCGPVIGWAPVKYTGIQWWNFDITGFTFGENASKHLVFAESPKLAISDTGTPLIRIDAETLDAILRTVKGAQNVTNENYSHILPCDADYPPVMFHIAGQNYTIGKEHLTIPDASLANGMCGFGIAPIGLQWVLGEPFIRKYCQVHDFANSRIGFAEANY